MTLNTPDPKLPVPMKSVKVFSPFRIFSAASLLFAASLTAQPQTHQEVFVAPGDEKTAGFAATDAGTTFQLNVKPIGSHKFRTGVGDGIIGENRDSTLWQLKIDTTSLKTYKVMCNRIHDPHEAVFKMQFKQPEGSGGSPSELPDAFVKAVNCFVKIYTPGTIAAPGSPIPAPTMAGVPYIGILQPNTDDEIANDVEDWTTGSKTGAGLSADKDLVKVELSWNPVKLRRHMVDNKVLQLILPINTKAYLASGAALTNMTVTIGSSASGQLAELGGNARKQNIFIEGNAAWAAFGANREITLSVIGLNYDGAEAKAKLVPADLAIHNGQAALVPVPEKDEEDPGAFTVANLNDTDGDTVIDNVDDVVKMGAAGTDEEDLMELVVTGPAHGKMKITPVSGALEFWEKSTKETKVPRVGTDVFIECANLPKTIWVEVTNHSATLRDIEMHIGWETPDGQLVDDLDTVKATAVWAEKTDAKHTNGDALWMDAGNPLMNIFNDSLGGVFGPNFTTAQSGSFHFTIGFEFTVKPTGIGQEPGVAFDITRDIAHKDWSINGNAVLPEIIAGKDDDFDAGDVSDDDSVPEVDEDILPSNDKIYSLDGPDDPVLALNEQIVSRNNFEEFVRIAFDGVRPSGTNDNGSRCSDNIPWHAFYWVDTDPATGKHRMRAGKLNEVDEGHLSLGSIPTP